MGVTNFDTVQCDAVVLGTKSNHIANAKVNYTTGDLDIEAEIIAAINATNTTINAILTALEANGILKKS